jgi:Xaa-Pro aminopeptidase
MSGLGGALGGFSQGFLARLKSELPQARLEDVSDIFADLRTIKSAAEIDMIERANVLFDLAVERVHATARPGMTGAALIQEGIKAMWEAGGDMDSTLGLSFGAVPAQNPILGWMSLRRPIQHGDIATLTAHAECGGYAGHSDAEISIGEPKQLHRDMFGAVVHVRRAVLSAVKPGNSHADLQQAYRDACQETGFRSSPHSQIHQYGIDVPEFPGPSFMDGGKGRNWRLEPGMVYSISPTLVAPESADTLLGGTCLVVTPTGYRELGDRKVELLVANK